MPSGDLLPGHGAGWLDPVDVDNQQSDLEFSDDAGPEELNRSGEMANRSDIRSRRRTRTAIFVTGVVASVAGALIGAGFSVVSNQGAPVATPATATTTPPSTTTAPHAKACAGVMAQTVTDGPGETTTAAGVIAEFEHAYYVERNTDAALAVVGPLAGISREGLAAAITALPAGVTHCVGVDVIAENTAHVHLVELHPDSDRLDFLQLINVATTGSGLVITNIQKRGG